jgi:hypothetical protein
MRLTAGFRASASFWRKAEPECAMVPEVLDEFVAGHSDPRVGDCQRRALSSVVRWISSARSG